MLAPQIARNGLARDAERRQKLIQIRKGSDLDIAAVFVLAIPVERRAERDHLSFAKSADRHSNTAIHLCILPFCNNFDVLVLCG